MALAKTEEGEHRAVSGRAARLKRHIAKTHHAIPGPEQEALRGTVNSHLHGADDC